MERKLEEFIQEEAEARNMPVNVIKEIFLSQFKIARRHMTKGEAPDIDSFVCVRLPFLGRFMTKEERIIKFVRSEKSKD